MCEAYHILLYRDELIAFSSEGQIMKTHHQIKPMIPFLHFLFFFFLCTEHKYVTLLSSSL